jgi:hypothetical protein
MIGARTRERAHDKVEIRGREPLPTIRPNHRDRSISIARARDKRDSDAESSLDF